MLSSIELDKINNTKIKKILTKGEIEDIEKCLISMSEEGTGRDGISNYSEKKCENQPNMSELESQRQAAYEYKFSPEKKLTQTFGIKEKINLNKENLKFNNNFENNPNLIFSNKNLKNLKSKSELKSKSIGKNINKSNNSGGNTIKNLSRNTQNFSKKSNHYINIDNQSEYESNHSNVPSKNQVAVDLLESLPNKIFIDSEQYNRLKYKPQSDIRIDELVIYNFI
jgi:hypothetical protein